MPASFSAGSWKKIAESTRGLLLQLLEIQRSDLGRMPAWDEFYPIDLWKLSNRVLGWSIEELRGLGVTGFGERITGRCDFSRKVIQIDSEATAGGERAYTLAHEIGHAVLHRDAPLCSGSVLHRQRSLRRGYVSNSDAPGQRVEREAEVFARDLLMPEKAVRRQFEVFLGHQHMWAGSRFAEDITPHRNLGRFGPDRTSVAEAAAVYKPQCAKDGPGVENGSRRRSLTEFFGVSRTAMAARLLELELVI